MHAGDANPFSTLLHICYAPPQTGLRRAPTAGVDGNARSRCTRTRQMPPHMCAASRAGPRCTDIGSDVSAMKRNSADSASSTPRRVGRPPMRKVARSLVRYLRLREGQHRRRGPSPYRGPASATTPASRPAAASRIPASRCPWAARCRFLTRHREARDDGRHTAHTAATHDNDPDARGKRWRSTPNRHDSARA